MISKKWVDASNDIIRAVEKGVTYKELGEKYGVTRERIRQVYNLLKNAKKKKIIK